MDQPLRQLGDDEVAAYDEHGVVPLLGSRRDRRFQRIGVAYQKVGVASSLGTAIVSRHRIQSLEPLVHFGS